MASLSVKRDILSWRSWLGYDNIREARESKLVSDIEHIKLTLSAVQCSGYPGHFVTPYGDVFSSHRRRLTKISQGTKPSGYKFVGMGGKKYEMVHRLVALAFIPNEENLPHVNHKDWNKSNNDASNLEWISREGNAAHGYANPQRKSGVGSRHNLSEDALIDIKTGSGTYREIGLRHGISSSLVCSLRGKGKSKNRHLLKHNAFVIREHQ